jgi:hypothetical protein
MHLNTSDQYATVIYARILSYRARKETLQAGGLGVAEHHDADAGVPAAP